MAQRQKVVIDACCIINILAARRGGELLRAVGWSLLTPELTRREVLYLDEPPSPDGTRKREKIEVCELEESGDLRVVPMSGDILDEYVECAKALTDADAATVALAGTHGLPLMSDDPKVRRVARERFPKIEVWSTLRFLKAATDLAGFGPVELGRLAFDIRWRGGFLPPNGDPDREWFSRLLCSGD